MSTYTFEIVQTNHFEVEIEAENEDLAIAQYDEMMTEDFGEPISSRLDTQVVGA